MSAIHLPGNLEPRGQQRYALEALRYVAHDSEIGNRQPSQDEMTNDGNQVKPDEAATKDAADGDLIRYAREQVDHLAIGAMYLLDIAELVDQIKDAPENREKLATSLRRRRRLLELHVAGVQGLVERASAEDENSKDAA